MIPVVLLIGGLDPSGCAGLAADIRAVTAAKAHAAPLATAVTAQNTKELASVHLLPSWQIDDQLQAVLEDLPVKAVKTGLLPDAAAAQSVATALRACSAPLVVDPVMTTSTGGVLARREALQATRRLLLPRATLVTPNIAEAAALLECAPATGVPQMRQQAREIARETGAAAVLLTGGHLPGETCTDVLWDGREVTVFSAPRIPVCNTRGTGCTLASFLAALLARGMSLRAATERARASLQRALEHTDTHEIGGKGPGPVLLSTENH